jgi:hypothetical protein
MNQELLSQEHMLSQQEVSELETGICHTLVEEMHGTYGLQVIRKAYQNRSAWGNDIELESDRKAVPTYIMGKSNIPLCVVGVFKDGDRNVHTFKSIKNFKERGDTCFTQSFRMSALMKNISNRNAVENLVNVMPKVDELAHKVNDVTNSEINDLTNEYNNIDIQGGDYHELLKYASDSVDKPMNIAKEVISQLEKLNELDNDIQARKKNKATVFNNPVYIIGYNSLSESYYETVIERNPTEDRDNRLAFKLSNLHSPNVGDYPVNISDLPNYDKYGSILPMWATRLPEILAKKGATESVNIQQKYFVNNRYSNEVMYDAKLSVISWSPNGSYHWGQYDHLLAVFNIEEVK